MIQPGTINAVLVCLLAVFIEIEGCVPEKDVDLEEHLKKFACGVQQTDGQQFSFLNVALHQLEKFNNELNGILKEYDGVRMANADYGMTCPNVTRLLMRFEEEKKVRVFYNMLIRMEIFLHDVIIIIPNTYPHVERKKMYSKLFCNLKLVICEFKIIQTRPQKPRKLSSFRVCVTENWNMSKSKLFDLQVLTSMQRFFSESYEMLSKIDKYDKTILS